MEGVVVAMGGGGVFIALFVRPGDITTVVGRANRQ